MEPNKRTFVLDRSEFGTVRRTNVLGLANTPEIMLDDNTFAAYVGPRIAERVVDAETGQDGHGQSHQLPMDVKSVGYLYLGQMGVTAEQQQALLFAWRGMPLAERNQHTANWDAVDKQDAEAVATFITGLVTFLQSQMSG